MILIHNRKSRLPSGTVTTPSGAILGRVRRDAKIAAGTNGERRTFYSAEVRWRGARAYIGTRYVTRVQATAALQDFHRLYTEDALQALIAYDPRPLRVDALAGRRSSALYTATEQWRRQRRSAHPFNVYPNRQEAAA